MNMIHVKKTRAETQRRRKENQNILSLRVSASPREISGFKRRRRAGWSLIEAMAAMALLIPAMLITTQLMRQLTGVMTASRLADDRQSRIARITDEMRADVWNSFEIARPDATTAIIKQAGDRSILWRLRAADEGQFLERLAFAGPQQVDRRRWPMSDMQVLWEVQGPVLTALFYVQAAADPIERRLISQLQLAGRKP